MPTIFDTPFITRVFTQKQTTFAAINNSGGTWSSTGAKYQRVSENGFRVTPVIPKNVPDWLTGTRSMQPGILGRKSATFEFSNMNLIPSGAAGTAPDCDHLLYSAFGQAGTVVSSTSVTYSLTDDTPSALSLFMFRHGQSGLTNQIIWGAVVQEVEFVLNQDFLRASFRGMGAYMLDSDYFASEDTTAKAGLTSFAAEPGSISYNGSAIPGYPATVTIDSGSVETQLTAATIRLTTGYRVANDVIASPYGAQILAGQRQVAVRLQFRDSDLAALKDLKQKAKGNSTIAASIVVGSAAGSILTFTMPALQLIPHSRSDQADWVAADFGDSMAPASAIGNTDELSIAFT